MAESRLFSGKNYLIAGALQPCGRALCHRLSARGGFVVAVDKDAEALHDLSKRDAERIAPLAMDLSDIQALDRLTSNWGPDPMHGLIMAHPLDPSYSVGAVLRSVERMTSRLAPVLEASHGAALALYEAPKEQASPIERAHADALARLTAELATDGARINALSLYPPAMVPRSQAQLCATALMMLLPMSSAVGGAVLPVGQHGMPGSTAQD